jgi:plasmid stability protein
MRPDLKEHRLLVLLTETEAALLKQRAARESRSVSGFVRTIIRDSLLADEEHGRGSRNRRDVRDIVDAEAR